jgi:hypothetical protein
MLAAMPAFAATQEPHPLSPESVEIYRRGALAVSRRLLGIPASS